MAVTVIPPMANAVRTTTALPVGPAGGSGGGKTAARGQIAATYSGPTTTAISTTMSPEVSPPGFWITSLPLPWYKAVGPMPNFATATAANPPPSAIAARHVVPAARAASATVTIATTEIAMPTAANVDVGGTVPSRSWMLSTTRIEASPSTAAAASHSSDEPPSARAGGSHSSDEPPSGSPRRRTSGRAG